MSRASLKALSRKPLTIDELFETFDALSTMPPQAQVVICVSLLEDALKQAILKKFRSDLSNRDTIALFDNDGPLDSFAARTNMAFALEIIGQKTRADFNCIRDIRNAFAHSRVSLTFDHKDVADACNTLTAPKRIIGFAEGKDWPPKTPAQRFRATAKLSWLHITQRGAGGHPLFRED